MSELTAFQDAMCAALGGEAGPLSTWLGNDREQAPGLSVYRNTVARGAVDALTATYATVVRMVGEEWFRAAAGLYCAQCAPVEPSLLHYGADFPAWLSSFPPARDTPYLAGIAQLDLLWWESYFAGDADVLDPQAFARLSSSDLSQTTAHLHPSVRLASSEQNLASLWLSHQPPASPPTEFQIEDRPQWIAFARTGFEIAPRLLDQAGFEFLTACGAGASLLTAAERALAADPRASFPDIISTNLKAGVFSHLATLDQGKDS